MQQVQAVDSGYWPVYRYDPSKSDEGDQKAFELDAKRISDKTMEPRSWPRSGPCGLGQVSHAIHGCRRSFSPLAPRPPPPPIVRTRATAIADATACHPALDSDLRSGHSTEQNSPSRRTFRGRPRRHHSQQLRNPGTQVTQPPRHLFVRPLQRLDVQRIVAWHETDYHLQQHPASGPRS